MLGSFTEHEAILTLQVSAKIWCECEFHTGEKWFSYGNFKENARWNLVNKATDLGSGLLRQVALLGYSKAAKIVEGQTW